MINARENSNLNQEILNNILSSKDFLVNKPFVTDDFKSKYIKLQKRAMKNSSVDSSNETLKIIQNWKSLIQEWSFEMERWAAGLKDLIESRYDFFVEAGYAYEGYVTSKNGKYYIDDTELKSGQILFLEAENGEFLEFQLSYLGEGKYVLSQDYECDIEFNLQQKHLALLDIRQFLWRDSKTDRKDTPNHSILTEYLNKNNKKLQFNKFKALLLAMDLISLFKVNKELAIIYAATQHNLKKEYIENYILDMERHFS